MADETTSIAGDPLAGNMGATGAAGGGTEDTGAKRTASDTIREEASKYADQAKEHILGFAGTGKDRATSALDEVAEMMRTAAGDVDAKLGEQYGQYARTAADGIAGFADSLRGKDVNALLDEATEFVKKSPAIAVGTAAALGFVLARVIKAGIDASGTTGSTTDAATPTGNTPSTEDLKVEPVGFGTGPSASPGTTQS
ncbi:hypothetical protein [Sphingomonas sp. R1]|uniref:hypothetical protein n=1 Tax=Sphingomonas sp. R1 TaxID=399176 RepID=UPI0022254658|nr:hypothetical protein [Sphingomonas sp. R1]UYY78198.1 hypothetical protein OIM94_04125 [Sphingomonas sp. R1]